jgi:putative ABC transport system permease protein
MLRQVIAISVTNLISLRTRVGASVVVILGVAGVVFVVTALLAMANGLQQALQSTGQPDRVIILGKGSRSEINGSITREQAGIIADLPGIAAIRLPDGQRLTLASGEIYASVNLPRRSHAARGGLPLRGVVGTAFRVRPELRITAGRPFEPGHFELIVGAGAARVFTGLDVGDTVFVKGTALQVVGHFEAGGRATESEAWLDRDVMADLFRRGVYLQSVLARLESPSALGMLNAAIDADRRLSNSLFLESDYYQVQSESSTRLMKLVGIIAGTIMALGAVFGALNALYAAVSARTREIAILKALGYSAAPIVTSVLTESLTLSLIGGLLGTAIGWLMFHGSTASSVGATYSQIAFQFAVTPALLMTGVAIAVTIGLAGGALPAVRAARQRVADGLQAR